VSIEETLTAIHAAVAPLRSEIERLRKEVRDLGAALPPQLLTVEEAAQRLRAHPSTVRRWLKTGELRQVRCGHSVRVDLSSVRKPDEQEIVKAATSLRRVG
jgi:excisionase family DNA binding protein